MPTIKEGYRLATDFLSYHKPNWNLLDLA